MQRASRIMIAFQLMFTCLVTLGTNANVRKSQWKVCRFMIGIATRDVREEEKNLAILNLSVQVVNT